MVYFNDLKLYFNKPDVKFNKTYLKSGKKKKQKNFAFLTEIIFACKKEEMSHLW